MRQVILYRDEDGDWVVECPSLKGCVSQGKTKEEALANIKEAISGYIAALEEDDLPFPVSSQERSPEFSTGKKPKILLVLDSMGWQPGF